MAAKLRPWPPGSSRRFFEFRHDCRNLQGLAINFNIFKQTTRIEMSVQLAVDRNPYLDNLIDSFDALAVSDSQEEGD